MAENEIKNLIAIKNEKGFVNLTRCFYEPTQHSYYVEYEFIIPARLSGVNYFKKIYPTQSERIEQYITLLESLQNLHNQEKIHNNIGGSSIGIDRRGKARIQDFHKCIKAR